MPGIKLSDADREALTHRIQFGGDEVTSATLQPLASPRPQQTPFHPPVTTPCLPLPPLHRPHLAQVVKAKAGGGSATLSMAYAGYLFTEGVLKGLKGESVTQCAYVESTLTDAAFFASPCKFGPDGVQEVLPFGELSAYEKGWFDKMLPELKAQIQKGVEYANK